METWEQIVKDPEFISLPEIEKNKVRQGYFKDNVYSDPEFKTLPAEMKQRVISGFLAEEAPVKNTAGYFGQALKETIKPSYTAQSVKDLFTPPTEKQMASIPGGYKPMVKPDVLASVKNAAIAASPIGQITAMQAQRAKELGLLSAPPTPRAGWPKPVKALVDVGEEVGRMAETITEPIQRIFEHAPAGLVTAIQERKSISEIIRAGIAPLSQVKLAPEERKYLADIFRNYNKWLGAKTGVSTTPVDEASAIAGGLGLRFLMPDVYKAASKVLKNIRYPIDLDKAEMTITHQLAKDFPPGSEAPIAQVAGKTTTVTPGGSPVIPYVPKAPPTTPGVISASLRTPPVSAGVPAITPQALPQVKPEFQNLGSEAYIQAKKNAGGYYQLFYSGTRNEIFPGEKFRSASEARQYFRAMKIKLQTAEPAQPAAVKEPWEMTTRELIKKDLQDNWVKTSDGLYHYKFEDGTLSQPGQSLKTLLKGEEFSDLAETHEFTIKQAISEGKSVPPEVLKDYPDLVKPASTINTKNIPKEPWEMTRENFIDSYRGAPKEKGTRYNKETERWVDNLMENYSKETLARQDGTILSSGGFHKKIVKQALSEGKPVPPEVLKDYPDLVKPQAQFGSGFIKQTPEQVLLSGMRAESAAKNATTGNFYMDKMPEKKVGIGGYAARPSDYLQTYFPETKPFVTAIRMSTHNQSVGTMWGNLEVKKIYQAGKRLSPADKNAFMDLIDKVASPDDVSAMAINPKIKDMVIRHKNIAEKMRQESIATYNLPQDWGKEYGWFPHIFRGNFSLLKQAGVDDKGLPIWDFAGEEGIAGRYESQFDAIYDAGRYMVKHPGVDVKLTYNDFTIPDVVRLSRGRYFKIVNDLSKESEMSKEEIMEIASGKIGTKAGRWKFNPSLKHRKGYGGYSKDFADYEDIMSLAVYRHNRSIALTKLNRQLQPFIEKTYKTNPSLAQYLQGELTNAWGTYDQFSEAVDNTVKELLKPLGADKWMRPGFTNRSFGRLTRLMVTVDLENARFIAQQLFQNFQTTLPWVGEGNLGKAYMHIMTRNPETLRRLSEWGIGFAEGFKFDVRMGKMRPSSQTEANNRRIATEAFYLHGKANGMTGEELKEYAITMGVFETQFAPSPIDVPHWMRKQPFRFMTLYKRFPVSMLGQMNRLAHEGKWGGLAKMAINLTIAGGIKLLLWPFTVLGAAGLTLLAYQHKKKLREKYGKTMADMFEVGLPGLVGVDLSMSFNFLPIPLANTLPEQVAELVMGAPGRIYPFARQLARRPIGTERKGDILMKAVEKGGGTLGRTTNTVYELMRFGGLKSASGEMVITKEELGKLNIALRLLGFQPKEMSDVYELVEVSKIIQQKRNDTVNSIVNKMMTGKGEIGMFEMERWNALYPMALVSAEDIADRIPETIKRETLPIEIRQYFTLPKETRGWYGEQVGGAQ